jgi:hypothetical protein
MRVLEGDGWRLVVEPTRDPWPVLLGGEGWAAELTAKEALLLRRSVASLLHQLDAIADQLMEEEAITLEVEAPAADGSLWVELEGWKDRWQLRFVLSGGSAGRGLEGGWSVRASAAIAAALEQCEGLEA